MKYYYYTYKIPSDGSYGFGVQSTENSFSPYAIYKENFEQVIISVVEISKEEAKNLQTLIEIKNMK